MAACSFHRVCTDNTSSKKYASRLLYDSANNDIILVWSENRAFDLSTGNIIRFARFDPVTYTPHSEVTVIGNGTTDQYFTPELVVGPAGEYVVTANHGTTAKVGAIESADSGATWGSVTDISAASISRPKGLATSATAIHAIASRPTSSIGYAYSYARSGVATWAAGVNIFTASDVGAPGRWEVGAPGQAPDSMIMFDANNGVIVGWRTEAGETSNYRRLTAMVTTDAWATQTPNTLVTLTADCASTALHMVKTSTDRVYLLYHDVDASNATKLAYSDDKGATWTMIGEPTISSTTRTDYGITALDANFDSFLCLDQLENVVFGYSSRNIIVGTEHHLTYRSQNPASASGYVLAGDCTYTSAEALWQTDTTGHAIIVGSTLYRVCTLIVDEGEAQSSREIYILASEDVGEEPETPTEPEIPEATESGANDNSIYLRNNVAEGGGWSAHFLPVAFFMDWDEGDEETGREVPLIVVANPSMDPAIQDPALIPALTRINDPGSYTRRVSVNDGDEVKTLADPFQFRVITQKYTITEEFNRNVARGVMVAWQLDGDSEPTVGVWIDDHLNHVITLYNTFGKKEERFFPLPTFGNVGSDVQFVIEDHSPHFFAIDEVGLKYIPKKIRG